MQNVLPQNGEGEERIDFELAQMEFEIYFGCYNELKGLWNFHNVLCPIVCFFVVMNEQTNMQAQTCAIVWQCRVQVGANRGVMVFRNWTPLFSGGFPAHYVQSLQYIDFLRQKGPCQTFIEFFQTQFVLPCAALNGQFAIRFNSQPLYHQTCHRWLICTTDQTIFWVYPICSMFKTGSISVRWWAEVCLFVFFI